MTNTQNDITAQLTGTDRNIFNIVSKLSAAIRRNRRSDLIKEFTAHITSSSSYEETLCRIMEYAIVK